MTDAETRWDDVVNEDNAPEEEVVRRRNYVAMVLDRSSSMSSIRQETIDAFNEQIRTIRETVEEQPIDVFVSLVTFADFVDDPVFWNIPLSDVADLNLDTYAPNGMTAMVDGVASTIERLSEIETIDDDNTSVLVVVLSDGAENHSRRYSSEQLAAMVTEKQNTGRWTFVYEGANQDLTEVSKGTTIPVANTLSFTADTAGVRGMSTSRQRATANYFNDIAGGVATASASFYAGTDAADSDPDVVIGSTSDDGVDTINSSTPTEEQ